MTFQTLFAYVGAVVIVAGTAVMLYAPDTYYQDGGAPEIAANTLSVVSDDNNQVAEASKR